MSPLFNLLEHARINIEYARGRIYLQPTNPTTCEQIANLVELKNNLSSAVTFVDLALDDQRQVLLEAAKGGAQ